MSFLDGDDSDGGDSSSNALESGASGGIRINEKFAKSFEKEKRAQELQVASRIDLDSDEQTSGSESDSETEDEDADLLTPALDLQIMKTINKIRSKDPDIYDSTKDWFGSSGRPGAGEKGKGIFSEQAGISSKSKKMRYKDMVREQIVAAETAEDVISSSEEEDDEEEGDGKRLGEVGSGKGLAYNKEQEDIRRSLLGSIDAHDGRASSRRGDDNSDGDGSSDEEDGLLLKLKKKSAEEEAREEEEFRREMEKMAALGGGDGDEKDREGEGFLRDFMVNRRWREENTTR
ncbi:unnamed protein product [Choristocarpus tenellus]